MLSYQHIYHAGNFADVQKHAVLVKLLQVLAVKPQKFCVMDTHAGRGLYNLAGAESQKLGEFTSGILPFWETRATASPMSEYLKIVEAFNEGDTLRIYPGSAKIAHHLLRATDSLILIERHPGEYAALKDSFKNNKGVIIEQKDGFQCLVDQVPFPDRRGLILVDPSYEIKTEYAELPKQLHRACKKWPQGQFIVWYPILAPGMHRQMLTILRNTGIKDMLVSEINLETPFKESFGMTGSGIIIINPPFGFETDLNTLTQWIARRLPVAATGKVFWLDNQQINPDTGALECL